MEYVKAGSVADTTPPPAPSRVRVSAKAGGAEITWEAEADFESGIGGFAILRDGQELAKLPGEAAGERLRAATVSRDVIPRHAGASGRRNAICGPDRQGGREAYLCRRNDQQRRTALETDDAMN
jgi:hypothetical protein